MNAFHVLGGLLALWALVVSYLGITRESFPDDKERLVAIISVVLVIGAVGSAIITSATEEEEGEEEGAEAALVLPR